MNYGLYVYYEFLGPDEFGQLKGVLEKSRDLLLLVLNTTWSFVEERRPVSRQQVLQVQSVGFRLRKDAAQYGLVVNT